MWRMTSFIRHICDKQKNAVEHRCARIYTPGILIYLLRACFENIPEVKVRHFVNYFFSQTPTQ